MKLLLVLVALLLGVWLWRSGRGNASNDKSAGAQQRKPDTSSPQNMVACKLCGLHVPQAEATQGSLGLYCCVEHQRRAEP